MRAPYKDDYYAILEIAPSASQEDIRKAYLRLSKDSSPRPRRKRRNNAAYK